MLRKEGGGRKEEGREAGKEQGRKGEKERKKKGGREERRKIMFSFLPQVVVLHPEVTAPHVGHWTKPWTEKIYTRLMVGVGA